MVAGFNHFPLVLDRLDKINPNFDDFFWKSHVLENIIHFLGGKKNSRFFFFSEDKNYRWFTF